MEYSIYNSIVPLTDKTSLLYSGLSDKFVIFKKKYEPLIRDWTPEMLKKRSVTLYSELLKSGAIIEETRNEFEELRRLSRTVDSSPEEYCLIINPTMNCNFKCWYCYENHVVGSKMSPAVIEKCKGLIDNILLTNKELKVFNLSFFGGEPLLYYNDTVAPIINHLRSISKNYNIQFLISFTSNAFLINDKIIEHLAEGDEKKHFQITLDGNKEQHNKVRSAGKKDSYQTILTHVSKLLQQKIEVLLRINYTSDNLPSVEDILSDITPLQEDEKRYLSISFHRVWQDPGRKGDDLLLEKTIDKFKHTFRCVLDSHSMDRLRYSCYADKINECIVNYNGDIFKCTARDFTKENRLGTLTKSGVIGWEKDVNQILNTKLRKKICRECRILPLCGGGCSQRSYETQGGNICLHNFTEEKKDQIVLERFYNLYVKNRKEHAGTPVQTTGE